MEKRQIKPDSGIVKKVLNLLYPPVCPLCDKTVPTEKSGSLCNVCELKIKIIREPKCMKCGKQLESDVMEYCEQCKKRSFHFIRGFTLFNYEEEAKELILKLKYKGRRDIAEYFARQIIINYGNILMELSVDAIVPVPIHKERLISRGYNQAESIASLLSRYMGIPCVEEILVRKKQTEAQKKLSGNERLINLYDAFDVDEYALERYKKRMNLKRIILVDDIFTTGSTIECCSLTLNKHGVDNVWFVAVAATRSV